MKKETSYNNRDGLGRFVKGSKPIKHRDRCRCPRCNPDLWSDKKLSEETKRKITQVQKIFRERKGIDKYRTIEWLNQKYWKEEKSIREVAEEINVSPSVVNGWMKQLDIPRRTEDFTKPKKGSKNGNWKGGILTQQKGYIYILSKDHPNVDKKGYYPKQNLVMEKHLGRYLKKGEVVHHLDGDKKNNRLENLRLMKDNGAHRSFEEKSLRFVKQLIWGNLKPKFKEELQKLFSEFLKKQ